MPVKMRFRTDGWHYANLKTHGWTRERFVAEMHHEPDYINTFEATPIAEPGDVWRMYWYKENGDRPLNGYAICCIKCGHVHLWGTAGNCQTDVQEVHYKDDAGNDKSYKSCVHKRTGTGSCWNWTGCAEDNTLDCKPSLLVTHSDCNFHGFLDNGMLRFC